MINGERKEKDVVTSFDGCSLASDLPCDKTKREEGGVRGRLLCGRNFKGVWMCSSHFPKEEIPQFFMISFL